MATFLSLSGSIISIFSHSILIKSHHQCTSDGVPGFHTFELPFFFGLDHVLSGRVEIECSAAQFITQ